MYISLPVERRNEDRTACFGLDGNDNRASRGTVEALGTLAVLRKMFVSLPLCRQSLQGCVYFCVCVSEIRPETLFLR